ncbi:MAG: DinB family protein [Fibrobacterota bacterium]
MSSYRALSGTPALSEWSPFHLEYLTRYLPGSAKAPGAPAAAFGHEDDALTFLGLQLRELEGLAAVIPADKETFRYAPGKWSVRELLGHMADTERIQCWRALAAARGDQTNILPFDQEAYVARAGHGEVPVAQLVTEIVAIRKSSLALFATFDHEAWRRRGVSNGSKVSARAWAFVIGAHAQLHLATLKSRYLA